MLEIVHGLKLQETMYFLYIMQQFANDVCRIHIHVSVHM